MCLLVTIAAGCPLPTAPIDLEHRHIAVIDLARYPGTPYHTRLMTRPYVYDVTSRYGCACALQASPLELAGLTDETASDAEMQSARETIEDLQRVADLVEIGLATGPVELLTCWESDRYTVAVESRHTVTLEEFRQPGFGLVERQMLIIVA